MKVALALLALLGGCRHTEDLGFFPDARSFERDGAALVPEGSAADRARADGADEDVATSGGSGGASRADGQGGSGAEPTTPDAGAIDAPVPGPDTRDSGRGAGGESGSDAGPAGAADGRGSVTITASPRAVSFAAVAGQGTPPAPASVSLTTTGDLRSDYVTSISYGINASGWLSASGGTAPGPLSVSVKTTDLAPGTYAATVVLAPTDGGAPVEVRVTYALTAAVLGIFPTSLSFDLNADAPPPPGALERAVMTTTTGPSLSWTATSSVPWLSVTPAGITGATATLSLVPAQIDQLIAGAHAAKVIFAYSGPHVSARTETLPVSLALQSSLPMVNFVAPYVALPNVAAEVILRGLRLTAAAGGAVSFGSSAASTFTVVNDTEIRATHPPLAAGSYPVHVVDSHGLGRTRANLLVKEPPAFSYAALPSAGVPSRVIYDAERMAAYVCHPKFSSGAIEAPRIERHRFLQGGWVTDSLLPLNAAPDDIALTPDGRELIVLSGVLLYHVDPDASILSAPVSKPNAPYPFETGGFCRMEMSNDGNAVVLLCDLGQPVESVPFRYNVLTKTFEEVGRWRWSATMSAASLDGSRILFDEGDLSPMYLYMLDTSLSPFLTALTRVPIPMLNTQLGLPVRRMSFDRAGTTAIVDGDVYRNRDLVWQAHQPELYVATLSPDGTRGYGLHETDNGRTLGAFDLTEVTANGHFAPLGPPLEVPDSPGAKPILTITFDGGTVFIAGDRNLVVQPVR